MIPLLFATAALLLVLAAAQGIRMISTSGIGLLEDEVAVVKETTRLGFYQWVDKIGQSFSRLTRGVYGPERLASLETLLRNAGRPGGLTQVGYIQRHTGFLVLGLVLAFLFLLIGNPLPGVAVALLFGAWMPLWIRLVARDRRTQIDRDLPDFLDVLSVTVNAGVPFRPALARVRAYHEGPLSDEVGVVLDEMALGISRRDAFTGLRERTGSQGVATFVTALLQAEELGVPLADALDEISSEIRRERAQEVKQAAAKSTSKVSLVVTTTIVPASILLIMAVLIAENVGPLLEVFQ